jgi:hypothetical protein
MGYLSISIQPPPDTVPTGLFFTVSVIFLLSSQRPPDAVHSASLLSFFPLLAEAVRYGSLCKYSFLFYLHLHVAAIGHGPHHVVLDGLDDLDDLSPFSSQRPPKCGAL